MRFLLAWPTGGNNSLRENPSSEGLSINAGLLKKVIKNNVQ